MKQRRRRRPLSKENFERLKALAQDTSLTYRELQTKIPELSIDQIVYAAKKKRTIPRRDIDYDKLQRLWRQGGVKSAIVRWGTYNGEDE